jgi:two-component system response regulator MprA
VSTRVLSVSSDAAREVASAYWRKHGLTVVDAEQPEQALQLLDHFAPDVVVTDITFRETGLAAPEFIHALRGRLDSATSIIVVSRFAREEDRETARRAGADGYLIKPVLPHTLLNMIRNALTLRRRGRRLPWNWRTGQLTPLRTAVERRQARAAAPPAKRSTAETTTPAGRPPLNKLASTHVLLVEDDPSIREMMVILLESEGFSVIPVADGADALAYLKHGGRARVVLLDLMMPRMDGWTFRRQQRADPAIADIPVIVVSACLGASASSLDAAATFQKPVDVSQVVGAVRQIAG